MSATVSTPIVQLAFGFGNLISVRWLAIEAWFQARLPRRNRDVCAKGFVFIYWPRRRHGDSRGTGADGSRAVAGPGWLRARRQRCSAATATSGATDFSARRRYYRGGGGAAAAAAFAGIVGTGIAIAAAQNYRDDYYYGGARAITAAVPAITVAAPPITAVVTPITADTVIATRACPATAVIRLPAGNSHCRTESIRRLRRAAGGFF